MTARRLLAFAAVLMLVAAACGDSDDSAQPPETVAAAPPATPAPAADETVPPTDPPTTDAPAAGAEPTTTTTGTDPATTTSAPPAAIPAEWRQVVAVGEAPEPRSNAVLAYDPVENTAYLHGGRSGGSSRADLWALDLDSGAWSELPGSGEGPAPRFSHTGIWDEQRRRLVVFSGEGAGFGDFFSDVWAYDPTAGAWEQLAPGGAGPTDRYGSCAGYDAAGDRFVITHGFTDAGRFDDTWAYDLASDTWTELTPGTGLPGARCLHACGYDAATGTLVMFGGQDDDVAFLDETWVFDGTAWSQAPAGPSARKFPGLAPVGGAIVVFGGDSAEGDAGDTWQFTSGGWSELSPPAAPSAREGTAAASDAAGTRMIIFGGAGPDGELNDTWLFTPGT